MRLAFLVLVLAACVTEPAGRRDAGAREAASPPVTLTPLSEGVWLHSSYRVIEPYGPIVTNGLLVASEDGAWLIDTAWTDEQTREVLRLAQAAGHPVAHAVFTHAHDDKMGGVAALKAAGIETHAHPLSNALAPKRGLEAAHADLAVAADGTSTLQTGRPRSLEIFYPGPAHTMDNIVVYVPTARVLFGGCIVRPGDAADLGNTADADVGRWATSTQAVASRFLDARIVVPSHGTPGTRALLDHTIALAKGASS